MKSIISAHTTHSNTPESDQLLEVEHDVHLEINGDLHIITIMANDPLDALEKAHDMSEKECLQFIKKLN